MDKMYGRRLTWFDTLQMKHGDTSLWHKMKVIQMQLAACKADKFNYYNQVAATKTRTWRNINKSRQQSSSNAKISDSVSFEGIFDYFSEMWFSARSCPSLILIKKLPRKTVVALVISGDNCISLYSTVSHISSDGSSSQSNSWYRTKRLQKVVTGEKIWDQETKHATLDGVIKAT